MSDSDAVDIKLGSQTFHMICREMNLLLPNQNAGASFDGMSGGFKFSDEIPQELINSKIAVTMPLIGLLRCLWAYRQSLVCGAPRSELAIWWETTKEFAPNWPGFLTERSSVAVMQIARQCASKQKSLAKDFEQLDLNLRQTGFANKN